MPVIWGFDLRELSFKAFSSKRMFDKRWRLRRERFVLYQLAMIICLAAECTATYSLAKYEDLQGLFENRGKERGENVHFYQNDIVDCIIATIVFCVLVATVFGADFFFLLQYPRRRYPDWVQTTKKATAVFVTAGVLACCIASTYVVATRTAALSGIPASRREEEIALLWHPPMQYNKWAVNIAWVVVLWVGWVSCVPATWIMFVAADMDKRHGTDPIGGDTETLRDTMPAYSRAVPSLSSSNQEAKFNTPEPTAFSSRAGTSPSGTSAELAV